MRTLLRAISLLTLVACGFTASIFRFIAPRDLDTLLQSKALALTTLLWLITLSVGPVAVIRLWRLKNSGRFAALVVWGSGALCYISGLTVLRTERMLVAKVVLVLCLGIFICTVLLLPNARAVCRGTISTDSRGAA